MAPNVGVNVSVNNDCRSCCPRVLRIFGCCYRRPQKQKINEVAQKTFQESDLSDSTLQEEP